MSEGRQQRLPDLDGSGIIRVEKRDKWLTLENATVRDRRLSFGARGLLAYLLSHPNKWEVKVPNLVKQSPAGRDAIYTLLRELRRFRYLVRKRQHGHRGRIAWVSVIYETPQGGPLTDEEMGLLNGGKRGKEKGKGGAEAGSPLPAFPYMDGPYTVGPDMDKPDTDGPYTENPEVNNYELLSDESLSDESLSDEETNTHTRGREGAGESVCVFPFLTQQDYIRFARSKPSSFHNPDAWAMRHWALRDADYLVVEALYPDRLEAAAAEAFGPPREFTGESCSACYGSKMEVVEGRGARACTRCVDERGRRTGREPAGVPPQPLTFGEAKPIVEALVSTGRDLESVLAELPLDDDARERLRGCHAGAKSGRPHDEETAT